MHSIHTIGIKKIIFLFATVIFLLPSSLFSNTKQLAVFYTLDGNIEKEYNKFVAEELVTIGFNSADPHHRVNDQYKTKYGSTTLDVLSFLPVVNDNNVMPLFNKDPRLAGFAPFNMLIYKMLDENKTYVGHLMPEAMLDMIGIKDKELRDNFTASFKPLDTMLDKKFGTEKKTYKMYEKLSKDNMINFEYEFERPEDIDDFVDEFQNKFEMSFINKNYLIAGFHDFMATDNGEDVLAEYDLFWGYSLCHLEYSYNMFDNKNAQPMAGLYAPCTMYMNVKKGTNTLVLGMPKLINIMDTLNINDPERLALIDKLDREIPEILTAFGMHSVENVNPLKRKESAKVTTTTLKTQSIKVPNTKKIDIVLPAVPSVPVALKLVGNSTGNSRTIKFSKRIPVDYLTTEQRYGKDGKGGIVIKSKKGSKVGEVDKGRISAYLRDNFIDVDTAKKKLENAGFKVLATLALDKKKKLISIVFTNDDLLKIASKDNRGFMGTLRLLIDPKNKQISITNPLYLGKAMLQNDFDEKALIVILNQITKEFKTARNSFDKLKYQLLPNYQFMDGMPFYKDMTVVARGDDLLEKLERKKSKKKVVFKLKLQNGSTLIGVKLSRRTRKFPKRIGSNNAGMLPYPLLIENGEARILEPKYYLSLMYPQLSMEEFMTIATIPGAIIKDCSKVFR